MDSWREYKICFILVCFILILNLDVAVVNGLRSFTIDYDNDTFLKDGKPFQYMSGSLHYGRVPHYYWKDRLQKMYAAGLDAVQTYVTWNTHEYLPGKYNFEGQQDLGAFFMTAQSAGLAVILRAGPYICGEWEYGGFPAWLLSDNVSMIVRVMDSKKYISAVDRWFGVLLPYIKPYLYHNGGPIIMVQVENEYGSYGCDHSYLSHLRDITRQYLGNEIVLFTTDGDGDGYLKCGAIDGVYATVDFGPTNDAKAAFAPMRKWNPKGPLVNSEFYTGWLDHWGNGHAHTPTSVVYTGLKTIHDYGANLNMYMFIGGTNFGFTNGADPAFAICPTSYDYDAPLTEAGDITDKYLAIRNLTSQYKQLPSVPSNVLKFAYGRVAMTMVGTVTELLRVLAPGEPWRTKYPVNMEQANYFHGFVVYRHVIDADSATAVFEAKGIRDRGYVLADGIPKGMLDRNGATSFNMFAKKGQVLDIVVENQGRLNYGYAINDNKKGLISNVTLGGTNLSGWAMYHLETNFMFKYLQDKTLKFRVPSAGRPGLVQIPYQPAVYVGSFVVPSSLGSPKDTFLQMCGWFKGQAFLNGFNLGRYWPVRGPQITLYVPAGVLHPAPLPNTLIMLELESSPSASGLDGGVDSVEFVTTPILNSICFGSSITSIKEPPSWKLASKDRSHINVL